MSQRVLITGGAGFIGSHLADELLRAGYAVRALDNLSTQVHPSGTRPGYLHSDVELQVGDVRDADAVKRALQDVDFVYHFAATVGVGQSMYEVARYTEVNNVGTAVLLEALIANPVERLVVASSMSVYGEGLYRAPNDSRLLNGMERSLAQLKAHQWEVCDATGNALIPLPTPETKTPSLSSVYALSKYDQERLCLLIGRAYSIPTVALRFFNVFGTRQSLSNPYTGVLAIFASRYLNRKPPLVNEDGLQQRDFVSVLDVAQACRLALEVPEAAGEVFNIGSGHPITILGVAEHIACALGMEHLRAEVTSKYRMGDIRNCFADIAKAQRVLGYRPRVHLAEGVMELAEWLQSQAAHDYVAHAQAELSSRGLTV